MAEQVDEYTRVVNGKTIQVRAHNRVNDEVSAAAARVPGRPMIAAKPGTFANGRSIPGIWPQDLSEIPTKVKSTPEKEKLAKSRTSDATARTVKAAASVKEALDKLRSWDAAAQKAEERAVLKQNVT